MQESDLPLAVHRGVEVRKNELLKSSRTGPQTDEAGGADAKSTEGISPLKKRGPKTDPKTALRVAEIVASVARDGDWKDKSKLEEIRRALKDAEISTPGRWRNLSWTDQEDPLVIKAIRRRLETAKKARQENSGETPA